MRRVAGRPFSPVPDGTTGLFCFLPNPNLRPEVGKNKEVGFNFKFDNVFAKSDSFRAKLNGFQNDVDDYIDLVASKPVATSVRFVQPVLSVPEHPGRAYPRRRT